MSEERSQQIELEGPLPPGELGVEHPLAGIWEIAWPTILANLMMSITGIIDLKIVGSLGAPAIAAVGAGLRIFFAGQGLLMGLNAGTTALVARAWGGGHRSDAASITRLATQVSLVLGVLIALPSLLIPDVLVRMFDIDERASALAVEYIRSIAWFVPLFGFYVALTTALRASGDTRTPLAIGALANVINVVLDYGLVFGKLGLPRLGVRGAGIATGLAFGVGAILSALLWRRGHLRLRYERVCSDRAERLRELVSIGYPAAIEQTFWQGGFIAFLVVVSQYGTDAFAAYNIGVQLLSFSFVIGFGFSIAGSTLVGQQLGAGDAAAARASGWRALRMAIVFMLAFGGLIVASAEALAHQMVDDPRVVQLTVVFMYILGAAQPLMAIEFALGGALRGAGDTRFPMWTTLTGLLAVRVGIAALLARLGAPIEWIYAALLADYACKSTLLALRFRSSAWERIRFRAPAGP